MSSVSRLRGLEGDLEATLQHGFESFRFAAQLIYSLLNCPPLKSFAGLRAKGYRFT